MADLITRPDSRPERAPAASPESLAERLLDTQAPQRPKSTPRIRIEVEGSGRKVRARQGYRARPAGAVAEDHP